MKRGDRKHVTGVQTSCSAAENSVISDSTGLMCAGWGGAPASSGPVGAVGGVAAAAAPGGGA